jgi:hypothetical protein
VQDWPYRRLLPSTFHPRPSDQELAQLLELLATCELRKHSPLPAGYTYFGQLVAHDLSFMRETLVLPDQRPLDPATLHQGRKPVLDLDSLYGSGPDDATVPYCRHSGRFIMGFAADGRPRDLPRNIDGSAQIADPRNDDHLLLAQMQVMLMNCHNRIIDILQQSGITSSAQLYDTARQELTGLYRHLVLQDLAWELLPVKVWDLVIRDGRGLLQDDPAGEPGMLIEIAAAAMRLHGMVAQQYQLSRPLESGVRLHEIFTWTGKGQGREFELPADKVVDWRLFFESNDPDLANKMNFAMPLSVRVQHFDLPDRGRVHMPAIALARGEQLGLPSGQELCRWLLENRAAEAAELGLTVQDFALLDALDATSSCRLNTPLWVYIMLDSGKPEAPHKLGKLGGWLLADTLYRAARAADNPQKPWTVENSLVYKTLVSGKQGAGSNKLGLADLVRFTYPGEI